MNNLDIEDGTLVRLVSFISQISENYGKTLVLLTAMENALQKMPDTRYIDSLKEKIIESKEVMNNLQKHINICEMNIMGLKNILDKLIEQNEAISKLFDSIKAEDVNNLHKRIANIDMIIKNNATILGKIDKVYNNLVEKKKIIIGILAVFAFIAIWGPKILAWLYHILTHVAGVGM